MKKVLIVFSIVLSVAFLLISSPYAMDNNPDRLIIAKLSYDNDNVRQNTIETDMKRESLPTSYYNMNGDDSRLSKNMSEYGDVRTGITNDLYRSYLTGQNTPDSLVSGVSFDFTSNGKRTRGFDIGLPSGIGDVFQVGAAFITNFTVHELGHEVVANYVGAKGSELNFLTSQNGSFFLGTSTVSEIDDKSRLPYHMGGEFFADMTFEHALKDYRQNPTTYNKSLVFFSGTDFAWYCLYAYYLSDGHSYYDPVSIQKETGLSKDTIFSIALAKTMVNTYRVYSGQDRVIPYFTVDKYSANLNLAITF